MYPDFKIYFSTKIDVNVNSELNFRSFCIVRGQIQFAIKRLFAHIHSLYSLHFAPCYIFPIEEKNYEGMKTSKSRRPIARTQCHFEDNFSVLNHLIVMRIWQFQWHYTSQSQIITNNSTGRGQNITAIASASEKSTEIEQMDAKMPIVNEDYVDIGLGEEEGKTFETIFNAKKFIFFLDDCVILQTMTTHSQLLGTMN